MKVLLSFLAGALAVAACHQVVLALFVAAGWSERRPFSLEPTAPLGVPALASLMFWGGVWGVLLGALLLRRGSALAYWGTALLFGALAPTVPEAELFGPAAPARRHPPLRLHRVAAHPPEPLLEIHRHAYVVGNHAYPLPDPRTP